jgi:ABC-type transport system involved in multi-copper enzyme maturation permease subunit
MAISVMIAIIIFIGFPGNIAGIFVGLPRTIADIIRLLSTTLHASATGRQRGSRRL